MLRLDNVQSALSEDRVVPFLQPIQNINTGELYGVEVLARIIDTNKNVIFPDVFITELEKNKLIIPFTLTLMRKVLEMMKQIQIQWRCPFYVFFNTPANILSDPALVMGVKYFMRNTSKEIKPTLEVTERIKLPEHPECINTIKNLVANSVPLWLDDFCTGYSSFNSLKTGLFSGVKIPREFVKNTSVEKLIHELRQNINETERRSNISLIAEGVETMSQLNYIKREGVYLAQGYFICPPLCINDFIDYVKENH